MDLVGCPGILVVEGGEEGEEELGDVKEPDPQGMIEGMGAIGGTGGRNEKYSHF